MSKEKTEVIDFLKSEDPSFSMWTASNSTYPLIEWIGKMERFSESTLTTVTAERDRMREALDAANKCIIPSGPMRALIEFFEELDKSGFTQEKSDEIRDFLSNKWANIMALEALSQSEKGENGNG